MKKSGEMDDITYEFEASQDIPNSQLLRLKMLSTSNWFTKKC
jgi:hypothetical protein